MPHGRTGGVAAVCRSGSGMTSRRFAGEVLYPGGTPAASAASSAQPGLSPIIGGGMVTRRVARVRAGGLSRAGEVQLAESLPTCPLLEYRAGHALRHPAEWNPGLTATALGLRALASTLVQRQRAGRDSPDLSFLDSRLPHNTQPADEAFAAREVVHGQDPSHSGSTPPRSGLSRAAVGLERGGLSNRGGPYRGRLAHQVVVGRAPGREGRHMMEPLRRDVAHFLRFGGRTP